MEIYSQCTYYRIRITLDNLNLSFNLKISNFDNNNNKNVALLRKKKNECYFFFQMTNKCDVDYFVIKFPKIESE